MFLHFKWDCLFGGFPFFFFLLQFPLKYVMPTTSLVSYVASWLYVDFAVVEPYVVLGVSTSVS
ncbi:hypothetical protein L211DRAFT_841182 [Terfezia boudieri ATCC MYA-4762]|uniref:Uncharacterized protein n=1 Tax=Terfezia boudieri ATCC MYA-4762 TaxID=1051890 RepID=A0A3N4LDB1_9PEZI|nr:hypothetical protein L211DRAFT_841182 [Terfezia boudieri ATCC MYA-4762]